jgi:hypothetical protein
MRTMRICKVIMYPMVAVLQFFIARPAWLAFPIAAGLIAVAVLNLSRLLSERT